MFKRAFSTMILVLFIAQVAMPLITLAENSKDFVMQDGILIKYNGEGGDVVIPDGITTIGFGAFLDCRTIKSVSIPDTVTSIGGYAFGGSSITDITIPNSVLSLGEGVFRSSALKSIKLPDTISTIENYTFYNCRLMNKFIFPNSLKHIGEEAFFGCEGLTSINLPEGLESIGKSAFYNSHNIISINLPATLKSIGGHAFGFIDQLSKISIPNGVESIGSFAFVANKKLERIIIPQTVSSIGPYLTYLCDKDVDIEIDINNPYFLIKNNTLFSKDKTALYQFFKPIYGEYIVPESVTHLGESAFGGCSLTSVTLPAGLKSIGALLFGSRNGVTSLSIPASVEFIDKGAFYGCSFGENLIVDSENKYFLSEKGVMFNKEKTEIIKFSNMLETYQVPQGVTTISERAFTDCWKLKEVILPESLVTIEGYAFTSCSQLESIEIPKNVTSIGTRAFSVCPNLYAVTIPNSVVSFGKDLFANYPPKDIITIYGELGSTANQYADDNSLRFMQLINVFLNDVQIKFDQPPIIENGRTLVPLRAIFEALGAEVKWNEETQIISAICGICKSEGITHNITMTIGDPYMYTYRAEVNSGELPPPGMARIELDVPPMIVGGRTLVPARAVAESFGATVDWDEETQTVSIFI